MVYSTHGLPTSAASTAAARLGVPAIPPNAMRADVTMPPPTAILKTPAKRRNILIKALGDFIAFQLIRRCVQGNAHGLNKLTGLAILFAIFNEKLFQRHCASVIAFSQHQFRIQRDERRRHIADWRSIGDITADRAGISDLNSPDTTYKFAKVRIGSRQRVHRIPCRKLSHPGVSHRRFFQSHSGL